MLDDFKHGLKAIAAHTYCVRGFKSSAVTATESLPELQRGAQWTAAQRRADRSPVVGLTEAQSEADIQKTNKFGNIIQHDVLY
jgi:hypothetical protein